MRHRPVDGRIVEVVRTKHDEQQAEGHRFFPEVIPQHRHQPEQAQKTDHQAPHRNHELVREAEAIRRVRLAGRRPAVGNSEKRRVHHRLANAVFHHLIPGFVLEYLVGIAGRAVLFDDAIQELHLLQIFVDKGRRQVHVVAADVVTDRRLRTALVPFGVITEVYYHDEEVADQEAVFSGVFQRHKATTLH